LVDVVIVQFRYFLSGDGCFAGEEYSCSHAPVVYYREDGIVSVAVWELGDQVHGYDLEGKSVSRCGDSIERYFCPLCEIFVLLAFCASFHVLCDPFVHVGPPEVLADDCYGGVSSLVSSGFQVMESVEDLLL
jgi:hypothetical protein